MYILNLYNTPYFQVCIVEQILHMGIRQGVFEGDSKVKEPFREFHILPVVRDEYFHVDTPVSITMQAIVFSQVDESTQDTQA